MLDKIKSGLSYICCAFLGTFHFVFMAFNYLSVYTRYDGESETYPIATGYQLLSPGDLGDMGDMGDRGEISGMGLAVFGIILQVLLLLVAVALMAYGVIGILKTFGVVKFLPDKLGKMKTSLLANIALLGYAGLTLLMFMMLGIFALLNSYSESIFGYTIEVGVSLGAGLWLALIFGALVASAAWLLPVFVPALKETDGPRMNYLCAQCGKKASKNEKFCTVCGGPVVCEVVKQYEYVCSGCGKKAKKTDKFCNVCGGAIVAVEIKPMEYVCGNCGRPQNKNNKFCNVCGGAVIAREVAPAPMATPMAAPVAAPQGRVCPVCGKPSDAGQKFCTGCGSIL